MSISYEPLWHTLIKKNMNKTTLGELIGASSTTIARLGKNGPVSIQTLHNICIKLDCDIQDVVEIIHDEPVE